MNSLTATPTDSAASPRKWNIGLRESGTLVGLVLICVVFSFLTPIFLTPTNLVNILQQSTINACLAIGMTLVIISGRHRFVSGIDRGFLCRDHGLDAC